jgi:hypothetical protein
MHSEQFGKKAWSLQGILRILFADVARNIAGAKHNWPVGNKGTLVRTQSCQIKKFSLQQFSRNMRQPSRNELEFIRLLEKKEHDNN